MNVKSSMRRRKTWAALAVTAAALMPPAAAQAQITVPVPPLRRPVPSMSCANRPVGVISYGGIYYNDHSANTTMSPASIRVGGSFQINSCSMAFGPGKDLRVVLEVLNRQPGSFGVTRLRLMGVTLSGSNRLVVRGPDHPVYGHQSYRVVVVTYTNGRPDSYASPGILTVQ
jgi:hypothetical protein